MDHPCFRPVRVSRPGVMRPVRVSSPVRVMRPVRYCEDHGGHYAGRCCNDGCLIDEYGRPMCYADGFDCLVNN